MQKHRVKGSILFTELQRDSCRGIHCKKFHTVQATPILHTAKISNEDGMVKKDEKISVQLITCDNTENYDDMIDYKQL